jgi:hypothetical protein
MILKATRPVLLCNTQYRAGDTLPADNELMVEAWLEAGSAAWVDDEEPVPEKPAKAKPASATAGMPGLSSDGDPDALIGRVPTRGRKKKS